MPGSKSPELTEYTFIREVKAMEKTIAVSRTDGQIYEQELWDKDDFRGRETVILSNGGIDRIPIPDDVIICDYCNAEIDEFPVPVINGNALCQKCYQKYFI